MVAARKIMTWGMVFATASALPAAYALMGFAREFLEKQPTARARLAPLGDFAAWAGLIVTVAVALVAIATRDRVLRRFQGEKGPTEAARLAAYFALASLVQAPGLVAVAALAFAADERIVLAAIAAATVAILVLASVFRAPPPN